MPPHRFDSRSKPRPGRATVPHTPILMRSLSRRAGQSRNETRTPVVTLLTDFGLSDPYVGVMKGVILSLTTQIQLVDITHSIPPQSVQMGAWVLHTSWRHFPEGTCHLVVVDPGVGGDRAPLVISAGGHFFVAPDNGVLTPVLRHFPDAIAHRLENAAFRLPRVSSTFHGRDIFAPATAWLARGVPQEAFGKRHENPVRLEELLPQKTEFGVLGEVIYIDVFGNLITNLPLLEGLDFERLSVNIGGAQIPLHKTYQEVPPGELVALRSSFGNLEVAVNQGSAQHRLSAALGTRVELRL